MEWNWTLTLMKVLATLALGKGIKETHSLYILLCHIALSQSRVLFSNPKMDEIWNASRHQWKGVVAETGRYTKSIAYTTILI